MEFLIEDYFKEFDRIAEPTAKSLWVSQYEEVSMHTRGKTPTKLIGERRPYEAEEIKKYRLKAYEAITKAPVTRAINNITRVFNKANVTVKMPNDLKAYVEQPIFKKKTFHMYVFHYVLRRMIEDPNGQLVWWPGGEGLYDPLKQIEVEPILVLSKNIVHMDDDVLTFIAAEKSPVTVPDGTRNKVKNEGEVYYTITKDAYYKRFQYGEKSKKKFKWVELYRHEIGEIPAITLGGYEASETEEKTNEEIPFLSSYFSAFVAYANETIRQFSDHQGIMTVSGFPIREMEQEPCQAEGCKNGYIVGERVVGGKTKRTKCGVCNGTGRMAVSSPYGVLYRKEKGFGNDKDVKDVPVMRYITPPVDILKYSGEYWKSLLQEAEKSLDLLFIDEAQSGVAKEIDRETLLSTLDAIGKNIYENIMKKSLMYIGELRTPGKKEIITINLPASFKMKTESELLQETTELKKNNAPDMLIAESTREVVRRRFSGDEVLLRMCDVMMMADPYFIYTINEKSVMLASGAIDESIFTRSIYTYSTALQMAEEMRDLIPTKATSELVAELNKRIDAAIPKVKPRTLVDPNGN